MSYDTESKEIATSWGASTYCRGISYKYQGTWIYLDIYTALPWDKDDLSQGLIPSLKKDCTLYRYQTQTTLAGKMFPVIMLNEERQLLYHCNCDEGVWETKGIKFQTSNPSNWR